jgi:hypothetical protein
MRACGIDVNDMRGHRAIRSSLAVCRVHPFNLDIRLRRRRLNHDILPGRQLIVALRRRVDNVAVIGPQRICWLD